MGTEPVRDGQVAELVGKVYGGYRLERRLGSGASGEVWLGRHLDSEGLGAVKLLKDSVRDHRLVREYFLRECQLLRKLHHPSVLPVFASGSDFFVTGYVDGSDLARRMRNPLAPSEAIRITREIAHALEHAHRHSVIHRDVKPKNILIDREDNAYLADFGLASAPDIEEPEHLALGTKGFMAPEQKRSPRVGPAADQYSLARVLLELLLGESPPESNDEGLARLPDSLPASLKTALLQALAAEPERRWPSMEAFSRALASTEVEHLSAPTRLARPARSSARFGWVARGSHRGELSPGIERVDYSARELAEREALPAPFLDRLEKVYGFADFQWSMFGRIDRLGPITTPEFLGRATDLFVLLHGGMADRELWLPIVNDLCRRNAQAVVLTPDVAGYGGSRFRDKPTDEQASPRSEATLILDWLDALAVADIPTVIVGHSYSAVAVLCMRDSELGALRSRVALTPVFPFAHRSLRWQIRAGGLLLRWLSLFPRLKRRAVERVVGSGSMMCGTTDEFREWTVEQILSADPDAVSRTNMSLLKAPYSQGNELKRCMIISGDVDVLAPPEVLRRAAARLQLPDARIQKVMRGGHLPHMERSEDPETAARNQAELVLRIEQMMLEAEGASGSIRSGKNKSSSSRDTAMAHGSTVAVLAKGTNTEVGSSALSMEDTELPPASDERDE